MPNSEILKTFDEKRYEFKPYDLTCEVWAPKLMHRPDRHNEIELNYFPEGTMTYSLRDQKVTVPACRLAVFWGLVPHQIISYEGITSYYVCTIPLSQFIRWQLATSFVNRLLKGELLVEPSERFASYDHFLFNNWINDVNTKQNMNTTLLEMHSRMIRMANNLLLEEGEKGISILQNDLSLVERIAVYAAQNYNKPIKVSDIGKAVGIHPDYANSIFKKAFGCTLTNYIIEERIIHAQRRLVFTEMTILEIAYDCGFNSVSRFNSAFQQINGCTPREYRKIPESRNLCK